MKAGFGLKREMNNKLFYNDVKNDNGVFHFHSQIELYFITDGEMEVSINDQRRILKKGEMIDCDMQILEANNLCIDESILTGESIHIEKKINDLIYSGTYITNGN